MRSLITSGPSAVGLQRLRQRHVHTSLHRIDDVGPRQEAKASVQFRPSQAGATVLLVNFNSDKLTNVRSFINVTVGQ